MLHCPDENKIWEVWEKIQIKCAPDITTYGTFVKCLDKFYDLPSILKIVKDYN